MSKQPGAHGSPCSKKRPCRRGSLCDPIERRCVSRTGNRARWEAIREGARKEGLPTQKKRGTKKNPGKDEPWRLRQGQPGFNAYATRRISRDLDLKMECGAPFAYQTIVSSLVKPGGPCDRMAVIHRTGAGKTRTMATLLDGFFRDPRPKIVVTPTDSVRRNFYLELMRFSTPYRRHAEAKLGKGVVEKMERGDSAARKAVEDLLAMKGALRRAGEKGELAAPLRAYTYTSAGGKGVLPERALLKKPSDPIFKLSQKKGSNFDGTVVLLDEAHNLVRPTVATRYRPLVAALERALTSALGAVVVGMTATPIVRDRKDGQALMRVIRGGARSSEGFISYFDELSPRIYPVVTPSVTRMPTRVEVELVGAEPWSVYSSKGGQAKALREKKKTGASLPSYYLASKKKKGEALQAFCNGSLALHHGAAKWTRANMEVAAPKIRSIAASVASDTRKTLVLCRKFGNAGSGLKVFAKALADAVRCEGGSCRIAVYDKQTAGGDGPDGKVSRSGAGAADRALARFNAADNKRGEKVRVMVASEDFWEGVSFQTCRRVILCNPSPTWGLHKQMVGRVLRACGHHALPERERTVEVSCYVATLPGAESPPTADEEAWAQLEDDRDAIETAMRADFRDLAVDRDLLARFL